MEKELTVEEHILKHYGVKGMKWGVRKDASRADKRWGKKTYSKDMHYRVSGKASKKINKRLPGLNKKHKDGTTKAYKKDLKALVKKAYQESLDELSGSKSPSGKYAAEADFNWETGWVSIQPVDVEHSEESYGGFQMTFDENGFVTSMTFSKSPPDVKHYGVKGMKWGVRKDRKRGRRARRKAKKAARDKKHIQDVRRGAKAGLSSDQKRIRSKFASKKGKLKKQARDTDEYWALELKKATTAKHKSRIKRDWDIEKKYLKKWMKDLSKKEQSALRDNFEEWKRDLNYTQKNLNADQRRARLNTALGLALVGASAVAAYMIEK